MRQKIPKRKYELELRTLALFVLKECESYRSSYRVLYGPWKGRLFQGERDITDKITNISRIAKKFLAKARQGLREDGKK